ncbi:MAG: lysoplasmalogenase family protein [Oscillospiraceae bacterium]|nr:lysoplasmalogenase family protein [Oscillospiraceae bacterium]
MSSVFLCLFAAASAIHLYGSFIDDRRVRNASKGAVVLFLLCFYLTRAAAPEKWFAAALVFSLLGDVLLMFRRCFAAGGVSFLFTHICLIVLWSRGIPAAFPPFLFFPAAAAYAAVIVWELRKVAKHLPRRLRFPAAFYLCTNAAMNLAALLQLLSSPGRATALIYAGAVCFFLSDCVLFFVRFPAGFRVPRRHFPVMLLYIAGILLITLGVLGLR